MKSVLAKHIRNIKKWVFGAILISLFGCASNSCVWDFNYYRYFCLYKDKPSVDTKKVFITSLNITANENNGAGTWAVPPSVRLELSEMLYENPRTKDKAAILYQDELKYFPEAKKFVDLLLQTR